MGTKSTLERHQQRATAKDIAPAVVTLIVTALLVFSINLDPDQHRWHIAVALSPLLVVGWLVWAHVRMLRRCDEYQRLVHLQALAIGFAVVMVVAFAGSLLVSVDVGSEAMYLQVTVLSGVVSWVASLAVLGRR